MRRSTATAAAVTRPPRTRRRRRGHRYLDRITRSRVDRHEHVHDRGQPRLRHPGLRGAPSRPAVPGCVERIRGHGERRSRTTRLRSRVERRLHERHRRQRGPDRATRRPRLPTARSRSRLGFGATQTEAIAAAGSTANANFDQVAQGLHPRMGRLHRRARRARRPSRPRPDERGRDSAAPTNTSAAVLKASEDKTFPGAVVASLASPWGQAVAAGDPAIRHISAPTGRSSRRDLYETFTGLMAAGDTGPPRTRSVPVRTPATGRRFVPAQQL